jgi:hypothetical protein
MAPKETDYLIVGAGAVGLAFADTLIDEDPDCHVTIVDQHAKPGGHWNDAYGFVALHQPSATYGVNSMPFPGERVDDHGPNKGLHALASGTEVLAYFEKVMDLRLLPSGRVDYHPLSRFGDRDADGVARISQIFSGQTTDIRIRKKLVDATFYQTSVPATHTRRFSETDDVSVIPPGELPNMWRSANDLPDHYVVLGAGKTAMDTVVWLIGSGVDPDAISWVRPRESWLFNRRFVQPGEEYFEDVIGMQIALLEAAKEAGDSAEMMRILGDKEYFLRIDPTVEPEMFHFAVISQGEIDEMRKVHRVIRKGRVTAIERGTLHFGEDSAQVPESSLFIDCTATAVPFSARSASIPLFQGDKIVLQPLQVPLVVLSAAVTAFLEVHLEDDEKRNAMATPGPLTDTPHTFAYSQMVNMMNRGAWSGHKGLMEFLGRSRLDPTGPTIAKLIATESPKLAVMGKFGGAAQRCMSALIQHGTQAKALHDSPGSDYSAVVIKFCQHSQRGGGRLAPHLRPGARSKRRPATHPQRQKPRTTMLTANKLEKIMELENELREQYQGKIDAAQATIDALNAKQEELQKTIESQLNSIKDLSEKATANERIEQLNRELNNRSEKQVAEIGQLKKRVKSLQKDLEALREDHRKLTQFDPARMKKNLDANKKALAEKTKANDLLQKSLREARRESAEMKAKVEELEAKLADSTASEESVEDRAA